MLSSRSLSQVPIEKGKNYVDVIKLVTNCFNQVSQINFKTAQQPFHDLKRPTN